MSGKKYLERSASSGQVEEIRAIDISTGAADATKLIAADSNGKLDPSFLPTGVGPDIKIALASENLSAGDYVNVWNDTGTEKVRLADSTVIGRPAHGFVKSAVTSGSNATVYFEGPNDALSGLTIGSRYYLGAAGDAQTAVPVQPTNQYHQLLGYAVDATTINTDIEDAIKLVV